MRFLSNVLAALFAVAWLAAMTGCSEPLGLTDPASDRPQEPVRPFPYAEVEVRFDNPRAGITLAGTLTHPVEGGPFPTVILIHGSGRLERDVVVARHRIFLVLADDLTRRGFAVLRYDKRGLGESTGDYDAHTSNELADDVVAAFDFLRERAVVDPDRIGVVGLSEGGLLGPAVGNAVPELAFVVALGGPALPGEQVLLLQNDAIAAAEGATPAEREALRVFSTRFNQFVRAGESRAQLGQRIRDLLAELALPRVFRERVPAVTEVATSPWYRFFIDYDPAPALVALQQPILFFIGGKDLQVLAGPNLSAAQAALSGHPDATVISFPEINHALQPTRPDQLGLPSEYESIEQTIAVEVLDLVGEWIGARVR